MPRLELDKIHRIALALPGVTERVSHGEPCFFVQDKRPLCYFFHPTPSASGVFATWLGVYLDTDGGDRVDWNEIAGIVQDAFRTVAPKALIAELDAR